MDRSEFTATVADRTNLDESGARDAERAVLTTLGERLSEDESTDLAAQLPGDLGHHLAEGESGRRFSEEEFISRADQRMDTVDTDGQRACTAVLGVLLEAVDADEREAVVDQFAHYGFEDLLAETEADVDVADRTPGQY